ncbi:hypothetical protein PV11_08766 [Exophiala sideris]|uniref:Transcription factor domain-containing protein n=1 Tax=Exophiala sideris TaxID=1016849 RepID=A0A0D1Y1W2_9EURO|nr:hypothetical protein PV11_08766 [Exophiala sideris]
MADDYHFVNYQYGSRGGFEPVNASEVRHRLRFVQAGRRHEYPPTIFQPSRRRCKASAVDTTEGESGGDERRHVRKSSRHPLPRAVKGQINNSESATSASRKQLLGPQDILQVCDSPREPFSALPVVIDAYAFDLLCYYRQVYAPSIWCIEGRISAERSFEHTMNASAALKDALQDELLANALLAAASARFEHVDGYQAGVHRTTYFLQRCLRGMRSHLDDVFQWRESTSTIHLRTLTAVMYMMTAEGFSSNFDAAAFHINAARSVLELCGGLAGIPDQSMREMLLKCVVSIHSFAFQPCTIALDGWLPHGQDADEPVSDTTRSIISLRDPENAVVPIGLRQLIDLGLVPVPLASLIREVADCLDVYHDSYAHTADVRSELARWIFRRDIEIRHRLLALEMPGQAANILRLALIVWMTSMMTTLGLSRIGTVLSHRLKDSIESIEPIKWALSDELGAWVLSLGAMLAGDDSSTEAWLFSICHIIG